MTITVRMSEREPARLRAHADRAGISVSELVRTAIAEKLGRDKTATKRRTPYDHWLELGVDYARGDPDRGSRRKEIIAEIATEKHRKRAKPRP